MLSFKDFIPGKNVEGGGELIGSNHPTWVSYQELFQLELLDVGKDEELGGPISLFGQLLDDDAGRKVSQEVAAALNRMNALAEPINAEQPWKSANAAKLDKQTIADWIRGLEIEDKLIRKAIDVQIASDNGVENDKASLLAMLAVVKGGGLEKYWTDTEAYRCKGGNAQLATLLAGKIGAANIKLQMPVASIEVKPTGVSVATAAGQVFAFDDVVLAVPPSTWGKIQFQPALPAALRPQMGTAVKYKVAHKKRYWAANKLGQYSLTDGDISQTWELTDGQPDEPAGTTPAGMVAFSGGAAAERCRAGTPAARDARYAAEFEKLYPGFAANKTGVRFMDWPGNPWTLGGYSFPAPGQLTAIGQILYDGIGRLHFAGEHTSSAFVGYMEGGLNSGASLAKRLAIRDGVVKP